MSSFRLSQLVFSPVPTFGMMKTHVCSYPQASPLIFGPPHLCFGVWAELGGETRGGSSFFVGGNVPCPLALLLLCLFVFSGKKGRRLCYHVCFWQEVGKM